jgi:hypothetical protein
MGATSYVPLQGGGVTGPRPLHVGGNLGIAFIRLCTW